MGTFTDPRDGKTYKTVTIGKQTWMAENLNYEAAGSKSHDSNPTNAQKYGRLYDWVSAKKACPPGWHLPSWDEWQELVNFAGGYKIAGKKLKASSGWKNNGNGEDAFGFSALPSGCFYFDGSGRWWTATTATERNAYFAYIQCICYDTTNVSTGTYGKVDLYSVRCVQD